MPYNTKDIKTVNRMPVPQIFDEDKDDYDVHKGKDGQAFVKDKDVLAKLVSLEDKLSGGIVEDYYEGSSNYTKTYPTPMKGISIANDGLKNLTFTINGITRTVYSGEPYNGTLKPFTQIQINATDKYRVEVLS